MGQSPVGTPLMSSGVPVKVGLVEEQEAISSEFRGEIFMLGTPSIAELPSCNPGL